MIKLTSLEYLFWEFGVLWWGACLATAALTGRPENEPEEGAGPCWSVRFLTLTLMFAMLTACAAGTAVSFARMNGRWTYLTLGLFLLGAAAWRDRRCGASLERFARAVRETIGGVPAALRLVLWTLALTLLWFVFHPVTEWDSIKLLPSMQNWLQNASNPYDSEWHYVMFPELGYLPAMAITRDDRFFWLVSLKPAVLLLLGLYQLGLERGLTRSLSALAASNAVLMLHALPWGLPTIKNDLAHASGVVLFALAGLRILRGAYDRESGALLAAALTILPVKYSGVVESAAGLAILGVSARRELVRHVGGVARWACLALPFVLFCSGHYYISNFYRFGNPLFPFRVSLAGLHLPGTFDLSGTSILDNIRNPEVWSALFGVGRVSPAGVWFPLTLAGCLVVPPLLLAQRLLTRPRGEGADAEGAFLAAFVFAFWLIYFRSYYSAGSGPGLLPWLVPDTLFSLRYVEGVVGVGEVFLLGLLVSAGLSRPAYVLVSSSLASRVWIALARTWPPSPLSERLVALACVGAAVLAAAAVFRRIRGAGPRQALGWTVVLLAVAVFIPSRYEARRVNTWPIPFQPVWALTPTLPKAPIYFVTSRKGPFAPLYQFHIIGGRFDRPLIPITEEQLAAAGKPVRGFVVRVAELYGKDAGDPSFPQKLHEFDQRMERIGYQKIAGNAACSVLRPAPRVQASATRVSTAVR